MNTAILLIACMGQTSFAESEDVYKFEHEILYRSPHQFNKVIRVGDYEVMGIANWKKVGDIRWKYNSHPEELDDYFYKEAIKYSVINFNCFGTGPFKAGAKDVGPKAKREYIKNNEKIRIAIRQFEIDYTTPEAINWALTEPKISWWAKEIKQLEKEGKIKRTGHYDLDWLEKLD